MKHFTIIPALLLLAPALGSAADCKHSAPRSLDLDLQGVKSLRFEVGSSDLRIRAATGAPRIEGRACSSDPEQLEAITVTQQRVGDELRVELKSEAKFSGIFMTRTYGYLELAATLPADVPLAIELGSGDIAVDGMQHIGADVGSGDLVINDAASVRLGVGSGDAEISRVAGEVRVEVGSGDAVIREAGSLLITRVGSGDLEAEDIRGNVRIERLGSGDIELERIAGNVTAEDIGSGDLSVREVAGDLKVDDIGSGDVDHRDVKGSVEIPED
jgi:DUF4097 and DUF4098 domain-containing protein YvlB